MSPYNYDRCPKCGQGIWNLIQYGKAKLSDAEREFHHLVCFLEKGWISKPSDFDTIDPETKAGLLTYLEMESNKIQKEELKAEAQASLQGLKGRSNTL